MLCSDWSISHLPNLELELELELNHSMLTTSFRTGKGRGKKRATEVVLNMTDALKFIALADSDNLYK